MGHQRKDIARRTSITAASSSMPVTGGDGEAPLSQRVKKWAPKVRTGCLTCRARRVKCDEGKPECNRCVSTGRTCKGYQEPSARGNKNRAEGARYRPHHEAGPSKPPGDQVVPSRCVTGASVETLYNFDHSLSASSSMNQGRERESSSETHSTEHHLSDLLGGLRVDEQGIAPYLRRKPEGDEPSVTDDEGVDHDKDDEPRYLDLVLPIQKIPAHKNQLPPSLMPTDSTALRYFELYFEHAHPYVPVLDKVAFYHQWNTNRKSISPLLLEAVFAIGSRLGEDSARVSNQWLAMASNQAYDFMGVPRLSTLQALLIIIKAREAAPERGYYYRSWMMICQCVRMGKDLCLDEHFVNHQSGNPDLCNLSSAECRLHTRLWQVIFVVESMIGNPQGRHDLCVSTESVDFSEPSPISKTPGIAGGEESEYNVSRHFTHMARLVRNVRIVNAVFMRLRKKKNWGTQPEYLALEQTMTSFLPSLPVDLTVDYPKDNTSLPWLPSEFVGNLHSYYYLTIILFHRGVLGSLDPSVDKTRWKSHMMICYDSARYLCRLQEAVKEQFGMRGLQSMQRGYSFTVYAGLSCIVLHLVAIVSPDPDLNTDAREYFERLMRVLEGTMQAWWMPDLHKQIDAFREAFSADLSKPFVLRPEFPNIRPCQPPSNQSEERPLRNIKPEAIDTGNYQYAQATGPQAEPSIVDIPQHDLATGASTNIEPQNIPVPSPSTQPNWNPEPIFRTWNAAFAPPPQVDPIPDTFVLAQNPFSTMDNYTIAVPPRRVGDFQLSDMQTAGLSTQLPDYEKTPQVDFAQQYTAAPTVGIITPVMWQHLVANMYEEGQTRPF